jgi:hypothetical protein
MRKAWVVAGVRAGANSQPPLRPNRYKGLVPRAVPRLFEALLAALVLALAVGGASVQAEPAAADAPADARAFDGHAGPARVNSRALASLAFRGGPITTSTGEVVHVLVSDSLPAETPEKWAEFLVKLVHGRELSRLTTTIATLDEVTDICGSRALGCYGRNEMIAMGEPTIDGTTAEEVVRHEYGHHVAAHRLNTPWPAVDWGPKGWASSASVCRKVARKEAFPGDQGGHYAQNPGEAWAEVYRVLTERKAGITTSSWEIVDDSFYPSPAALVAAEQDVLRPWAKNRTATHRRTFGKQARKAWWIPVQTPLDGELRLSALLPAQGEFEVALVAANRRSVLERAQWVSQRLKRTAANVCGQRSLFVRLTPKQSAGRVTVTVSAP